VHFNIRCNVESFECMEMKKKSIALGVMVVYKDRDVKRLERWLALGGHWKEGKRKCKEV
jgi:hypothetical protein